MKKIFATLMLMCLLLVPVKKSEAGIIVIASGTATGGVLAVGYIIGGLGLAGAVGSTSLMVQGGMDGVGLGILLGLPSALLLTLDADGALPKEKLISDLSKKYPFIENQDVVAEIASLIREKAGNDFIEGTQKLVSLSNEEVLSLLSPIDLTGKELEVETLLKDLE